MTLSASLIAKKLLSECGISNPSEIPIEDLINYKNGIVQEIPLKNCEGRMVMKNGRAIISVNSKIDFVQKRRFILAHELGHMLMHGDKEATFTDDYLTLEAYKHGNQEKEANDFAAELLMPSEAFIGACLKKKFSSELLRSLANQFNTSITSVTYRYVELGNHPICIFYSKDAKVQYWKKSKDFWYKVPEINKLNVPSDSVANEYYSAKRIYRKEQADQTVYKSTWFELSENDRDSEMFEYCIITPSYNTVLSVIWEK